MPFLALILALKTGLAFVKKAPNPYHKGAQVAGLAEGVLVSLRPQPFRDLPWLILVHAIALLTVGMYLAIRLPDEPQLINASMPLTGEAIDDRSADKANGVSATKCVGKEIMDQPNVIIHYRGL